ncbi:Cys-Gln thioester bond-forming surface protein [Streptomyces sp. NA04227]|uniref:Cys-Gln thioester bond-forming surface protein n=1 Tax=Streptomyces sp. NA04227 TaxID=2742136 RepID=UPI0020CA9B37|nr:Cys-Gln thioester bond-forming surface protein [Streptomyces sp. NA04227]
MFTAAIVAGGAVAAGAGAAAAQEDPQNHGGATASLGGLRTHGDAVVRADGRQQRISAGLFEMVVDNGGSLLTYCVDLHNPTQKDAKYQETAWSGTSLHANRNSGKIRWILQNSYPQVNDLGALAKKAGARSLTEEDAAAGTQVAIWRYSDGADVTATDPDAEKLADYLQRKARGLAEPKASLALEGAAVSGQPGDRLGPVTVRTNADSVSVMPPADSAASGVRVVDGRGKEVTSARDGSKLYLDVPKDAMDGSTALTVQASTTVPVGRAFTSETRSQTQILAGSSESTVSATATVGWASSGAVPALSARKNCASGGVDITAVNKGDEDFTFALMGFKYVIEAGKSQTVTVPLQEDQAYDFTVTGPNGLAKRFKGVLDCKTQGVVPPDDTTTQLASGPEPASVGGTALDTDLADSGSSNSTPMIAGVAVALVVLGGAAVFLVRKRKPESEGSAED